MANANSQPLKLKKSIDISTVLGFLAAFGGIIAGLLLEGGKINDLAQSTAALIVLGGTIGAVLITTPFETFIEAVKRFDCVLFERKQPKIEMIDKLVRCSDRARRSGLASLEADADEAADPFLKKALNLAADGTDANEIGEILRLEMDAAEERTEAAARVWESASGYSPTVGIIGAVLGLIQVMKHLDKLDEVGKGIAVAFVATVYGVAIANLIFLPAAGKIKARHREILQIREIIVDGVMAIVTGMNPQVIRLKLEGFLDGDQTPKRAERAYAPVMAAQPVAGRSNVSA